MKYIKKGGGGQLGGKQYCWSDKILLLVHIVLSYFDYYSMCSVTIIHILKHTDANLHWCTSPRFLSLLFSFIFIFILSIFYVHLGICIQMFILHVLSPCVDLTCLCHATKINCQEINWQEAHFWWNIPLCLNWLRAKANDCLVQKQLKQQLISRKKSSQ